MKITVKQWIILFILACLGFFVWLRLEYGRFIFIDLSVGRDKAVKAAENYLQGSGVKAGDYLKAVVFSSDNWADRFLQKTLGAQAEDNFISKYNYELFSWQVRFFRELDKEEHVVIVSPRTGEITAYRHLIEDIEPRETQPKEAARKKAEQFLKDAYAVDFSDYDFHEEQVRKFDNRTDYGFSWERKGVNLPWKDNEGQGKLLVGAIVSGNEVREFYKAHLDVPEKFRRYVERQFSQGEYFYSIYFLIFIVFIICSIFIVVKRKSELALRISKKWYISLAFFFFSGNVLFALNNFEGILIGYNTSASLLPYLGLAFVKLLINIIFLTVIFIMPGLAGESLCREVFAQNPRCSFLHYLKSTFFSRRASSSVVVGYFIFFIILGFQALIFNFGQKYFGVWREWIKLTQYSSSYIPFLSAFIIAANASLSEEVVFRIFGISFTRKYLKNTAAAVLVASLIWGFGHSQYPVFPAWFRGIEVTCIGLLFGFIFLKFGIIVLVTAHYVFDAFLGVSAHIFGHSGVYMFVSSIFIVMIPLIYAFLAYILNRQDKEKEIETFLDPAQEYNIGILTAFISQKKQQGLSADKLKAELIGYNWDPVLVEIAIKRAFAA